MLYRLGTGVTRRDAIAPGSRPPLFHRVEERLGEVAARSGIAKPDLELVRGWDAATTYRPAHGTIRIGRKAARRLSGPALMGVLGHECAHLVFDDGARCQRRARGRDLVLMAALLLGAGLFAGFAAVVIFIGWPTSDPVPAVLSFFFGVLLVLPWIRWIDGSQHDQWCRELRADFQACRTVGPDAVAAGIDEHLRRHERRSWSRWSGWTFLVPASHPSPEQRLQAIASYDAAVPPDQAAREWLRAQRIYER